MANVKTTELQTLLSSDNVKERLNDILGKQASIFATSIMQIVKSNATLAGCEPQSIVGAAMTAATIKLPLNNNIGFAYIVPYKGKAQFQIGYKGFIQLAQRSGQFHTINVADVRSGEILSRNRQTGEMEFASIQDDKERQKKPVIGYVGYFKLLNGFEKYLYMSKEELLAHGNKFSQSFKKGFGLWKDDFDSMAKKTVIKLLLSKYAPLSIDMQTAVQTDQATFQGLDEISEIEYPDNDAKAPKVDGDEERILLLINSAKGQEDLDFAREHCNESHLPLIKEKQKELNLKNK